MSSHIPDTSFTHHTDLGTNTNTIGSWAQSTRSAIWLTNTHAPSHRFAEQTPWRQSIISILVIVLAVLLGASSLIDVYGSFGSWALAAVPAACLGALIALAGLNTRLRLWWQIVFALIAQWIIGPVICLQDTTIAHVIPTMQTLHDGWFNTFGSFKYVISIPTPVGTAQGALMAVWTIALWSALLAGFCAIMRDGRWSLLSTGIMLIETAGCALLSTATGWHSAIVGLVLMIMLIIWMSWRWQLLEAGRWIAAALIVVIAASSAFGSSLLLDQHRTILRDHYEPPLSPYDYTSPLSGMRAFFKYHKDDTLLTVTNLPSGTPVRLAVMDRFDGNVWNLSDSRESSDSSNYTRVGSRITEHVTGESFTAQYTIHEGLSDDWLPLAGAATSVTFDPKSLETSFYYNTGTQTGLLNGGLKDGMQYTETGIIPTLPSDEEIAQARTGTVAQPQAQDVPDAINKLATAIAGGQSSGGEAAQALADTLRERGWFSHGLSSDYPSLPGHGNYRLNKLLAGTAMVGDSEQYASAMALMARELGMPSRVVLGFLPKDDDGKISEQRTTTTNGVSSIEFTGNDITAWVEINLEGYGWVPFYPTPDETKIPDENQDMTPPNPQNLVQQPPVPLTDPLRDEQNTMGQSSLGGEDADEPVVNQQWESVKRVAKAVAVYGSPVWILLLICAVILLIKAIQLAYIRSHGRPQLRVAAGWQSIANLARQSGVEVNGTRHEQSQQIAEQLSIDAASLQQAQRQADHAAFSGAPISEQESSQYWKSIDQMRATILHSLPRLRRARTRLSLRGILHPSGNNLQSKRESKNNAKARKDK